MDRPIPTSSEPFRSLSSSKASDEVSHTELNIADAKALSSTNSGDYIALGNDKSAANTLPLTQALQTSGKFANPWDTWQNAITNMKAAYALVTTKSDEGHSPSPSDPQLDINLPIRKPTFGPAFSDNPSCGIRVTWLGHASVLFNVDGANILCDPIFSRRCSAVQVIGPIRFRPPPCQITDLPPLDAVVISHNHFDHMDVNTMTKVGKHSPNALWCVPSGCKNFTEKTLRSTKRGKSPGPNVWEALWWEEVTLKRREGESAAVKIAFTPTQHWSGRSNYFQFFSSLWGSWAIIGPRHRAWFAGDTGYCAAFKEIGAKYGPFDVAAIPIGAYKPRHALQHQHIDPAEAVKVHQDVKAKYSIGIHWGTFALGREASYSFTSVYCKRQTRPHFFLGERS
uniref:Metallo-beta-lactamase domain-containing protein n=1 Tax=Schistocephalus solidus TaxID=70667 RepID=A0A0X3P0B9_SCHSO